jgi:ferredoxin-NADP reductase
VYLCGPPAMATAVRRALRDAGVPTDAIHEERFSW